VRGEGLRWAGVAQGSGFSSSGSGSGLGFRV
jgi:hypothetical protein